MNATEVIIELSFEHYDRLLANCEPSSREHAIVRNAVISSSRKFLIRCGMAEAEMLLAKAKQHCPEVVYEIEKAIALALRA